MLKFEFEEWIYIIYLWFSVSLWIPNHKLTQSKKKEKKLLQISVKILIIYYSIVTMYIRFFLFMIRYRHVFFVFFFLLQTIDYTTWWKQKECHRRKWILTTEGGMKSVCWIEMASGKCGWKRNEHIFLLRPSALPHSGPVPFHRQKLRSCFCLVRLNI